MRASRGKYDYAQIAIKLSGTLSRLDWRYPSNLAGPSSTTGTAKCFDANYIW